MKDVSLQAQVEGATPHELSEPHTGTPLCKQMLNAKTYPTKKMKMLEANAAKDLAPG